MRTPDDTATLVDHLTELRVRVIRAVWGIVLFTIVSWTFVEPLMALIQTPIKKYLPKTNGGLVFTGVTDSFFAHIKLAVLCGIIFSCPIWLYQVWQFVAPGLYANEKKYSRMFIAFGSILFVAGISFAYFLVLPAAFGFLLTFGEGTVPMITIAEYLSFVFNTTLVFGAAFELPLLMTILGVMGLINYEFLAKNRRYAVVALSVLAAVVTPPDLLSMILLLIPLLGLFEIGVWLVRLVERKRAQSISNN